MPGTIQEEERQRLKWLPEYESPPHSGSQGASISPAPIEAEPVTCYRLGVEIRRHCSSFNFLEALRNDDVNVTVVRGYTPGIADIFNLFSVGASTQVSERKIRTATPLQKRLLTADSGYVKETEAAKRLGCSVEELAEKRRISQIIGIAVTDGFVYPAWQFQNGHLLDGLEEVYALLKDHDAWMRLSFMVSKEERLGGKTPLKAIREGELAQVKEIASTYGEQGAV